MFEKLKRKAMVPVGAASVMLIKASPILMNSGFDRFRGTMDKFWRQGLGGPGAQGIGIAILVGGIMLAIISFVVHKINPQSRMPGPIVSIVIAIGGSILMTGMDKPIKFVEKLRDILFDWIGL